MSGCITACNSTLNEVHAGERWCDYLLTQPQPYSNAPRPAFPASEENGIRQTARRARHFPTHTRLTLAATQFPQICSPSTAITTINAARCAVCTALDPSVRPLQSTSIQAQLRRLGCQDTRKRSVGTQRTTAALDRHNTANPARTAGKRAVAMRSRLATKPTRNLLELQRYAGQSSRSC